MKNTTSFPPCDKLILGDVGEAPHARAVDLLPACNLVLGPVQGLQSMLTHIVPASDGSNHLANVHSGHSSIGLSECSTHACLQSIGTRAGEHLVDTEDMEGMHTDTDMEGIFARILHHILVAGDAAGL